MFNIHLYNRTILAITSLACLPILYGLPLLFVGLDDINMVRHFDHGESEIALGWLEAYKNGPLFSAPVQVYMAYPKFFYNLAGIVLYPIALTSELDYKIIIVTWRILNMAFAGAASVALFFIARHVLKSTIPAYISSLLLVITPEFLFWSSNVRPNPLEQLLIFSGLIACLKILDKPVAKWFIISTLLAALAFSTKFGSIPLALLIPVITSYCLWMKQVDPDAFIILIKGYIKLFSIVLPISALLGAFVALLLFLSLVNHDFNAQNLLFAWTSPGVALDQQTRLKEVFMEWHTLINLIVWIGLSTAILSSIISSILSYKTLKFKSASALEPNLTLAAWLIGSILITTGVIYVLVYFLVSPAHIANPSHFLSHIGFEFRYVALGASHGLGESTPSLFEFLRQLFVQLHWGWLLFIPPLMACLLFRHNSEIYKDRSRNLKVLLWLFIFISFGLFLSTRYPSIRHVLPAIGIAYIFVAGQLTPFINRWQWSIKSFIVICLGVCIISGAGLHLLQSYQNWTHSISKPKDIGLQVGAWLNVNYPSDTKIMTDLWIFYVPPEFTNVKNTQIIEQSLVGHPLTNKIKNINAAINTYDPQVIITTDSDIHTPDVQLEELVSENYRMATLFQSDQKRDEYSRVSIFVKK